MGHKDRSSSSSDVVVALASRYGFVCTQNEQNQWEIASVASQRSSSSLLSNSPLPNSPPSDSLPSDSPPSDSPQWQLRQKGDRWLLVVNDTAQILLRTAEAIAFINRQANPE